MKTDYMVDWLPEDNDYYVPENNTVKLVEIKNKRIVELAYYYTENYDMKKSDFESTMACIGIATTTEEIELITF